MKLREGFGEDADIREQLHIDGMASVWAHHIGPPLPKGPEGDIIDYWDIQRRALPYETGIYYDQSVWPLRDATSIDDLESYRWPVADRFDDSRMEDTARAVHGKQVVLRGYTTLYMLDKAGMSCRDS